MRPTKPKDVAPVKVSDSDPWIRKFLAHLASDRGASIYTRRNYRRALDEFLAWYRNEHGQIPNWAALQRDNFRAYLRHLGGRGVKSFPEKKAQLSRAFIQMQFSALRTFYKFLARHGVVTASPIRNIALP